MKFRLTEIKKIKRDFNVQLVTWEDLQPGVHFITHAFSYAGPNTIHDFMGYLITRRWGYACFCW